jgi:hypothetical protein
MLKKRLPQILMALAVLLLLSLFIYPMWRITLFAPQYPDGVTMYIYINKIGGETAATLQNINILNHYVGMQYIEPESIPELVYFPFIIIGMAIFGLVATFLNNKWVYLSWAILMTILALLGLYDFYLWEHDYGTNLSPDAPIKIPGAEYQPPLFGKKVILNFIAYSYPDVGGILAGISVALAYIAGLFKKRK